MSSHSVMPSAEIEVLAVQRRRRYSAEEKQRLVEESLQPGISQLRAWFTDYNVVHPHSALQYRSPEEFIEDQSLQPCPVS